ncbi:hypothetical protein CYMTET_52594 [Cymbomonas tetramitiformis]|uniref:Uncharacterized protein n=1 Tax=Cymbomonas tetramitiformis TaxID=36881 RepID=A0AAE0ERH1_9CHLO|nr:hypothetical protein CYMTET_52594 [Cymbomonas tetramitiformis]
MAWTEDDRKSDTVFVSAELKGALQRWLGGLQGCGGGPPLLEGIRRDWVSRTLKQIEGAVETAALRRHRTSELAARRASNLDKLRQAVTSLENRRSAKKPQAKDWTVFHLPPLYPALSLTCAQVHAVLK